jgi:hypothetical protein
LRVFEYAPVANTRQLLTRYRQDSSSASCDDEAAWPGTDRASDRYFERRPGERDARLGRQVASTLGMFVAEQGTHTADCGRTAGFWRAFASHPSSVLTIPA